MFSGLLANVSSFPLNNHSVRVIAGTGYSEQQCYHLHGLVTGRKFKPDVILLVTGNRGNLDAVEFKCG